MPENPVQAGQEVLVFYDRGDAEREREAAEMVVTSRRRGWRAFLVEIEPSDDVRISNIMMASSDAKVRGPSPSTPIETFVFGEAPIEGWLVLHSAPDSAGARTILASTRVQTDAHWAKVRLEPQQIAFDAGVLALSWRVAPSEPSE